MEDEIAAKLLFQPLDIFALAGKEIVKADDTLATLQKKAGKVASDEPGGAGDQPASGLMRRPVRHQKIETFVIARLMCLSRRAGSWENCNHATRRLDRLCGITLTKLRFYDHRAFHA